MIFFRLGGLCKRFETAARRITGVTTTLPLLIGAVKAQLKATVVVAQRFCSLLVCGYGRKKNKSFVAAFAAAFDSSQNRCVVTPNVFRVYSRQDNMRPFEFHSPETLDAAAALLSQFGADAKIIAGGTDVLIELRKVDSKSPKAVIDISCIPELHEIREEGDEVVLKPLTTHNEILRSGIIRKHALLLSSAASTIGSPQIRNRGTVGGNIMNAAACADTVPPLIALNARITLKSASGNRVVKLEDFFVKPYVTSAKPDEILVDIRFPKLHPSSRSAFVKLGRRNAVSISRLSVAAILQVDPKGVVNDARIVPGAAFPTWQRITESEKLLVGRKPSRELFAEAGSKVSEVMISLTGRRWSTEYKEPVIAVLVRRALEECI